MQNYEDTVLCKSEQINENRRLVYCFGFVLFVCLFVCFLRCYYKETVLLSSVAMEGQLFTVMKLGLEIARNSL